MTNPFDIPLCEDLEQFGWNPDEVRDLIQTTPLRFDEDGQSVGYEAEQLCGLDSADLIGRSL